MQPEGLHRLRYHSLPHLSCLLCQHPVRFVVFNCWSLKKKVTWMHLHFLAACSASPTSLTFFSTLLRCDSFAFCWGHDLKLLVRGMVMVIDKGATMRRFQHWLVSGDHNHVIKCYVYHVKYDVYIQQVWTIVSRVETFPPATLVYFCVRKSIELSITACKVHVTLSVMSCADNDCCSTVTDRNASIRDIISHMTHDCTTCKIQETLGDGNTSIHNFLKKYDASIYICYKPIELKNSKLA